MANRWHPWPDETRAAALEVLQARGLAAAHTETGVPRGTISLWADQAGIDRSAITERVSQQQAAAAKAVGAATTLKWAERKAELVQVLGDVALDSAYAQRAITQSIREYVEGGDLEVLEAASLGQLVGAGTRAIHDLQLLAGEATERPAAGDPDKLVEVGGDKLRLLRSG